MDEWIDRSLDGGMSVLSVVAVVVVVAALVVEVLSG